MLRLLVVATLAAVPVAATVAPTRSAPIAGCGAPFVGAGAAWSPHGEIAFHSSDAAGRWSIWIGHADGSGARRLVGPSRRFVGHPAWSPDGRTIAYDTGIGGRVELVDLDSGTSRDGPVGGEPAWSPDGTRVAVVFDVSNGLARIDVVSLDGSNRRTVATDAYDYEPSPSWSPDGATIAYAALTASVEAPFIALVSASAGPARAVDPKNPHGPIGFQPRWSPDGTRIAYTNIAEDRGAEVHVISPGGRGDRAVARDPGRKHPGRADYAAAWSPDGRRLVYTSAPAGRELPEPAPLAVVDATGRGAHPLQPGCRFGTGDSDRMRGTARSDRIYALEGADAIDVRGGGVDRVSCGAGRDRVVADRRDRVARDCERVSRR